MFLLCSLLYHVRAMSVTSAINSISLKLKSAGEKTQDQQ